jgi:hypothetical protein
LDRFKQEMRGAYNWRDRFSKIEHPELAARFSYDVVGKLFKETLEAMPERKPVYEPPAVIDECDASIFNGINAPMDGSCPFCRGVGEHCNPSTPETECAT